MTHRRGGFTLVELLIALTIGAIIVAALHQVLQLQSQAARAQSAQIRVQQANRITIGLLTSELREVDPAEGDLLIATTDSIRVRVVRKLGLVCRPDSLTLQLNVWEIGDGFVQSDSVVVFAENNEASATDDVWRSAYVASVDTLLSPLNCGGTTVAGKDTRRRMLTLGSAAGLAGVRRGAVVRAYTYLTYGIYQVDGEWVIGRHGPDGTVLPLIGPVKPPSDSGLRFTYADTLGVSLTPTTAAQRAAVRRVGIRVRGLSNATAQEFTDSLYTQVFLRNE